MAQTLANIAERLNRRQRGKRKRPLPALILMSDETRLPDPSEAMKKLPKGSIVIVRHRNSLKRRQLAKGLRPLARKRQISLLIANDPYAALALRLNGVHFSEKKLSRTGLNFQRKPDWILTAAAHSPRAIQNAQEKGMDAVLISPIFATASHPNATTVGIARLAHWTRNLSATPPYALGGLSTKTAQRLLSTTVAGCAGISGLTF